MAALAEGYGANVLPVYALTPGPLPSLSGQPGIFRFRELLPLGYATPAVSLEEGSTPLLSLPGMAERLGVGRLLLKDETRNPTWSFKDRLAAVAVSKASGGAAVAVGDDVEILAAQRELAGKSGLYVEGATALALPALARLAARRVIGPGDTVVMLGTSSGLKDVGATAATLPPVELIGPTLEELDRALAVGAR